MLRDKGNMRRGKKYACFPRSVGPTISEVVKGWWGKGLGDFEKYIHVCTVYPGDAPWVDSMKLMICRKNRASLELLNIHLFLKIVYQKGNFDFFGSCAGFSIFSDNGS